MSTEIPNIENKKSLTYLENNNSSDQYRIPTKDKLLKVVTKTSDSNDVANTFTFKKNTEQKFDFENEKTKKKQKEINP